VNSPQIITIDYSPRIEQAMVIICGLFTPD